MTAVCGSTDLADKIAHGYAIEYVPQYGGQVTTIDGKDHSVKIRDRVRLTVPFLPLARADLAAVLALFPSNNAYVTWKYDDPSTGSDRTVSMLYDVRKASIRRKYINGTELWDGLTIVLTER